ncbi:hypothetical protein SISSUDRAFT_1056256 [Sistotremastrum suecicum HHB10207 ss-3]|uniref:Uncharacterized protein n=1 Tax=Sistotremastrum suecicum HHB10207 ss-3 TaxID=1314776 RepID=A0A165X3G8_9AGAM|nr:hypothetical protein SISSUDRAFT_1056256 [Sistotremastrum suecicum HHB10207 ss-3]
MASSSSFRASTTVVTPIEAPAGVLGAHARSPSDESTNPRDAQRQRLMVDQDNPVPAATMSAYEPLNEHIPPDFNEPPPSPQYPAPLFPPPPPAQIVPNAVPPVVLTPRVVEEFPVVLTGLKNGQPIYSVEHPDLEPVNFDNQPLHPPGEALAYPPLLLPDWQEIDVYVSGHANRWSGLAGTKALVIAGPSEGACAQILLWWIVYMYLGYSTKEDIFKASFRKAFPDPSYSCSCAPLKALFIQADFLSIRSGAGIGVGVSRSVIGRALDLLMSYSSLFIVRGAFYGIRWGLATQPGQLKTTREALLFAAGFLTLWSIFVGRTTPVKLSPFLLTAAFAGFDLCTLHPEMLAEVDDESHTALSAWFESTRTGGNELLSKGCASPAGILLMAAEIDWETVSLPISVTGIRNIELVLFSSLLLGLGSTSLKDHPDLLAFRRGLNFFDRTTGSLDTSLPLSLIDGINVQGWLTRLYTRQVRSVQPVLDMIRWNFSARDSGVSKRDRGKERDFALAFERYLRGEGAPAVADVGTLLTPEMVQDAAVPFLRARLFLKYCTSSSLLPPAIQDRVRVSIQISFEHEVDRPEDLLDLDKILPLDVHSCYRSMTVWLGSPLNNLLCQVGEGDSAVIFDGWVHRQFICEGYNRR